MVRCKDTLYNTYSALKKRNDSLENNLTQLLNICSKWGRPRYNPKGQKGGEMCATKKALWQTSENAWLSLWQGVPPIMSGQQQGHRGWLLSQPLVRFLWIRVPPILPPFLISFDSIIAMKLSCGFCHNIWNRRRLPPIMPPLIGEVPTWGKFMRTMSSGQIRTTPMFFSPGGQQINKKNIYQPRLLQNPCKIMHFITICVLQVITSQA